MVNVSEAPFAILPLKICLPSFFDTSGVAVPDTEAGDEVLAGNDVSAVSIFKAICSFSVAYDLTTDRDVSAMVSIRSTFPISSATDNNMPIG